MIPPNTHKTSEKKMKGKKIIKLKLKDMTEVLNKLNYFETL